MTEKISSLIEKNTRQLPQIATKIKFIKNVIRMPSNDSIDLPDGSYVMEVINFSIYNSIFNITSKNNKLYYYDGTNSNVIPLTYGA